MLADASIPGREARTKMARPFGLTVGRLFLIGEVGLGRGCVASIMGMAMLSLLTPTRALAQFGYPVFNRPVIQVPALDIPQISSPNQSFGYPIMPNTWDPRNSYVNSNPFAGQTYPYTNVPSPAATWGNRITDQQNQAMYIRNGMSIGMLRRQRRQLYYELNFVEKQMNNDRQLRKWQYKDQWEKDSAPYRKSLGGGAQAFAPPRGPVFFNPPLAPPLKAQ